jgi:AmiR/NasT family two-component response regulator
MKAPLRIAIADDEATMRQYLQEILPDLGHQVISVAENGRQLVEQCLKVRPDLVITDIRMPDMDGIDAVAELDRHATMPAIIVSAFHEAALLDRAAAAHVLAFLVKPIGKADLESAIAITMYRYKEFSELRQQAADLAEALENRKFIERAKGILMKRAKVPEPEAFELLQKMACHERKKLADLARAIVEREKAK